MMANPQSILVVHIHCPFQFTRTHTETVKNEILSDAIDPLTMRRNSRTHEITTVAFSGCERANDLTLHIHHKHSARFVAHHKLIRGTRKRVDRVDTGTCRHTTDASLERVQAFARLGIPDFDSSIAATTDDLVVVLGEHSKINEGCVTTELLECATRFQSMDTQSVIERCCQYLPGILRKLSTCDPS